MAKNKKIKDLSFNETANGGLAGKTIAGIIWKFGERISAQLVSTIVSIVLMRMLMPEQYEIIAIVTIFITVCNVFVSCGLGTALIQKKEVDEVDFSTVLYAGLGLSFALYALLFFLAPFIAEVYKNEQLVLVLRIMSLRLPLAAINSVQQALITRKMDFKKFFFSTLIGTIVSGFVGIGMAKAGCGVWSLVAQYLTNVCFDTVFLGVAIRWWPKLKFSFKKLKVLFGFGGKILASGLINTGYNELKGIVIGIKYAGDSPMLSYYNKGAQFPQLISSNINSSVNGVMLSSLSKIQNDDLKLKRATRKTVSLCAFILVPCMFGLAAIGQNFVHVLLTDKWLMILPFLYMMCFSESFFPIHVANLAAIQAKGRSDIYLLLEIIKKSIGLILLVIATIFGDAYWIASISVVTVGISFLVNGYPNIRILKYSYKEQFRDMMPSLLMSLMMAVPVFLMNYIAHNAFVLVLQIIVGIFVYISVAVIFRSKDFRYIWSMVSRAFANIRENSKLKHMRKVAHKNWKKIETEKEKDRLLSLYIKENGKDGIADENVLKEKLYKASVIKTAKEEKKKAKEGIADPIKRQLAYSKYKKAQKTEELFKAWAEYLQDEHDIILYAKEKIKPKYVSDLMDLKKNKRTLYKSWKKESERFEKEELWKEYLKNGNAEFDKIERKLEDRLNANEMNGIKEELWYTWLYNDKNTKDNAVWGEVAEAYRIKTVKEQLLNAYRKKNGIKKDSLTEEQATELKEKLYKEYSSEEEHAVTYNGKKMPNAWFKKTSFLKKVHKAEKEKEYKKVTFGIEDEAEKKKAYKEYKKNFRKEKTEELWKAHTEKDNSYYNGVEERKKNAYFKFMSAEKKNDTMKKLNINGKTLKGKLAYKSFIKEERLNTKERLWQEFIGERAFIVSYMAENPQYKQLLLTIDAENFK